MTETESSRRNEVAFLLNSGMSYAQIARQLGITRERVRQIAKGMWRVPEGEIRRKTKSDIEDPDDLLTTAETARLLKVHANTVRRWGERGILKTYRLGPRQDRRFRRGDVIKVLEGGKRPREQ